MVVPTLRQMYNQLVFGTGLFSKANVIKATEAGAWDATAKLRNQYIATSMAQFPLRVGLFRQEMRDLAARARHFRENRTVDPQAELVPLVWLTLEVVVAYSIGKCLGRRNIQYSDIPVWEDELMGGHHDDH